MNVSYWKGLAVRTYYRLTPATNGRVVVGFVGLFAAFIAYSGFVLGISGGASAAIGEGPPAAELIRDFWKVEREVWVEFGESDPVARLLYAPFHWLVFVVIVSGVAGIQVGVAVPTWAITMLLEPLSIVGLAVFAVWSLMLGMRLLENSGGLQWLRVWVD